MLSKKGGFKNILQILSVYFLFHFIVIRQPGYNLEVKLKNSNTLRAISGVIMSLNLSIMPMRCIEVTPYFFRDHLERGEVAVWL